MIYSIQREPLRKSLPTVIDRSYGIQTYDEDNIYPQRVDEVREDSYTAKTAVNRFADFIDGEGWQDPVLAELVLNSEGQTANDVLDIIAQDKALYTGFALHFKFNPFTYRIMEITPVEFMFCRLGIPDSNGNVCEIVYSRNWEMDFRKTVDTVMDWEFYPVFNPDPEVVKAQIAEYGWDCYPGQILYWTPKPGVYPKCRFHSVFDNAQAQSELGVYNLSSIQNKWTTETIIDYPGSFEDDKKRQDFKNKIAEHKGARGSGTLVIENTSGQPLNVIKNLEIQNTDKLFESTGKDIKNSIRESMGLPAEVMGQMPETGMFNQQQIQEAYTYTNAMTRNDRNHISRQFKRIMAFWKEVLTISSYGIIPQKYFDGATAPAAAGQPAQPGQPGAAPVAKREVDTALSQLSALEMQNIERMIRKVQKGKMTRDAGRAFLKLTYKMTDEELNAFIP
jgi:hypothetical protein